MPHLILLVLLVIFSCLTITFQPSWTSPILYFLGLTHCICGRPLNLARTHFFLLFPWWGMDHIPLYHLGYFHFHHDKWGVSCFTWLNSCRFVIFLLVFSLMGWHCVIGWWHSYLSRCYHYWSCSSIFGFVCCFNLWGGRNGDNSSKGKTLPQLTFNKCISSPCHGSFDCLH